MIYILRSSVAFDKIDRSHEQIVYYFETLRFISLINVSSVSYNSAFVQVEVEYHWSMLKHICPVWQLENRPYQFKKIEPKLGLCESQHNYMRKTILFTHQWHL